MRSDDDQWDITTSVGATALGVAAGRAIETRRADALVEDPYAQSFVDAAGLEMGLPGTSTATEDSTVVWDSMSTYQGIRSRFFDEFFASAATAGIRQAVLLAAGLDSRAYRLTWPEGATVYEVDQAEVLRFKAEVLEQAGLDGAAPSSSARRVVVAVDLRHDWPASLCEAGFDPEQPTAWLAEGLLPYLPPQAETDLFDRVQALSAPGSRIAVEHFGGSFDDMHDDPRMQQTAQMFGSDIRDLIYTESRDRTPDSALSGLGWKTMTAQLGDLARAYGRSLGDEDVAASMGTVQLLDAVKLPGR